MKSKGWILLSVCLLVALQSTAQMKAVFVEYKYLYSWSEPDLSDVPEEYHEQLKQEALQDAQYKTYELYARQGVNAFSPESGSFRDGKFRARGNGAMVIDQTIDSVFSQTELDGKWYVISDTIIYADWNITSERKEILGWSCVKATRATDGRIVWFCPDIPFPAGPMAACGLPGVVLESVYADGVGHTLATRVVEAPEDIEVVPLSKGRKVSRTEYRKLDDEYIASLDPDSVEKSEDGTITIKVWK